MKSNLETTTTKKTIVKGLMASFFMVSALLVNTSVVKATSLNVQGYVNPYAGTVIDGGTTTTFGRIDYRFDVVNGDTHGMNFLNVSFEDDVFIESSIGGASDITAGWSALTDIHTDRHVHLLGPAIGTSDVLEFSLFNVEVETAALTDLSYWDEGGVWQQSWAALYLDANNPFGFAIDGGSTAPVPEPASLILMGSGLLGLGLWKRKRSKV